MLVDLTSILWLWSQSMRHYLLMVLTTEEEHNSFWGWSPRAVFLILEHIYYNFQQFLLHPDKYRHTSLSYFSAQKLHPILSWHIWFADSRMSDTQSLPFLFLSTTHCCLVVHSYFDLGSEDALIVRTRIGVIYGSRNPDTNIYEV